MLRALRAPLLAAARALAPAGASAAPPCAPVRWANSKGGGSTSNGRDSAPKYLGVKRFGGEWVEPGNIIVRQRGVRVGVVASTATARVGRDHTVWALVPGYVKFWHHALKRKNYVEVVKSPPGVEPVEKYDIAAVKAWELPALDRVFAAARAAGAAPPAATPAVLAALEKHRAAAAAAAPSGGRGPGAWAAKAAAARAAATATAAA